MIEGHWPRHSWVKINCMALEVHYFVKFSIAYIAHNFGASCKVLKMISLNVLRNITVRCKLLYTFLYIQFFLSQTNKAKQRTVILHDRSKSSLKRRIWLRLARGHFVFRRVIDKKIKLDHVFLKTFVVWQTACFPFLKLTVNGDSIDCFSPSTHLLI